MLVQKLFIFWYMFFFLFFLLGCLFHLEYEVGMFDVCVLSFSFEKHKTRLLSCLDLLVWFFVFGFYSYLKKESKRTGHGKKTKPKMQKNTPKRFIQLAHLCSQIVFPINWWNATLCRKHHKNNDFGKNQKKKNQQWPNIAQILKVRNWSKHESKTDPSMLRNTIGPISDIWKWSVLNYSLGLSDWKISFSLQKEESFQKAEKGKTETWTNVLPTTDKYWANFWLYNMHTQIYIYIYMYYSR